MNFGWAQYWMRGTRLKHQMMSWRNWDDKQGKSYKLQQVSTILPPEFILFGKERAGWQESPQWNQDYLS